jgi:hypothetical protein
MTFKNAKQTMTGLKIIAALATASVVLSTSPGTASAGKRTAAAAEAPASCKNYEIHRYPGSRLGRFRYGEVVFSVFVCPTKSPSSWAASTRDPTTNATGSNLGVTFANTSIKVSKTGKNKWNRYARYEGTFTSNTCIPKVGWPCKGTGDWKVKFTITADKKSHAVHLFPQGGSVPDPGFVLFATP